ncbi:MAG: hypothetical protein ACTSPC_08280 [Candidatus Heimdallarchaeota archaeon]
MFSNRRKVLFPEPEGPIIPVMPLVSIATLIFERITLPSISKQTSSNEKRLEKEPFVVFIISISIMK